MRRLSSIMNFYSRTFPGLNGKFQGVHFFRHSHYCVTNITYRKIPKISPGTYIFQRPSLRGLSTEGNLRFKIDWASLIIGVNLTFLLCFSLYLRAIFQLQAPGGLFDLEGRFNGGFFALPVWGLSRSRQQTNNCKCN